MLTYLLHQLSGGKKGHHWPYPVTTAEGLRFSNFIVSPFLGAVGRGTCPAFCFLFFPYMSLTRWCPNLIAKAKLFFCWNNSTSHGLRYILGSGYKLNLWPSSIMPNEKRTGKKGENHGKTWENHGINIPAGGKLNPRFVCFWRSYSRHWMRNAWFWQTI